MDQLHKTRDLVTDWRPGDGARLAKLETEAQVAWPGGGAWQVTAEDSERDIRESDLLGAFVTEDRGRIVSICTIRAKPGQKGSAYIPYLNSHPDYHGKKHGKAVMLSAMERAVNAGYRMIDIGTWPANLKAVPLYKKLGFMWQPDTSVHLENFTPTARKHPLGVPYFRNNHWYDTLVRSLTLEEDLFQRGKVRVYEYVWRSPTGENLRMVFDRQSWEPVEIETDSLLLSCTILEEKLVAGVDHPVRWRVVNKGKKPISVLLSVSGDLGVEASRHEVLVVKDVREVEGTFTIDPEFPEKKQDPTACTLRSEFVIDGLSVPLANGFEVRQAVGISVEASPRSVLLPGRRQNATLNLRSNLDKPCTVRLTLAAVSGAVVHRRSFRVPLRPKGASEVEVPLTAPGSGQVTLEVQADAVIGRRSVPIKKKRIDLLSSGRDDVQGMVGEDHALIYAGGSVLSANLRHGRVDVTQLLRAQRANHAQIRPPSLGLPFSWEDFFQEKCEASLENTSKGIVLRLRSASILRPGIVLDRSVQVGRGPLIEVTDTITNGSGRTYDLVLNHSVGAWMGPGSELVVPTPDGILKDISAAGGQSLGGLQLRDDGSEWPEGWFCVQKPDGRVTGLIWREAVRVHPRAWGGVHLKVGPLKSGESRRLDPVVLFVGEGNWQTVQGWWRLLTDQEIPDLDTHVDKPSRPVRLVFTPNPLLVRGATGAATVSLQTAGKQLLNGVVKVTSGGDLSADKDQFEVRKLDGSSVFSKPLTLRRKSGADGPAVVDLSFETEDAVYRSSAKALMLPKGRKVSVQKGGDGDGYEVGNGILTARVSGSFLGSVVSLMRGRREFLSSAYPEPGMRGWENPWHGGIEPRYGRLWGGLHRERFKSRVVRRKGSQGLEWQGVDVACTIQNENARGQSIGFTYLLAPGVDVLAIVVRVKDVLGIRSHGEVAFSIYPSFGSTEAGASFYNGDDDSVTGLSARYWAGGGNWRWGGVTGSGMSLFLGAEGEESRAGGQSDGLGCHLWGEIGHPMSANETFERVFFLVPSTRKDVADTHEVWSEFEALP